MSELAANYDQRLDETWRIRDWRLRYALNLGYDVIPAEVIAGSTIDMHELEDLLDAGCPHVVAIRLLA